MYRRYIDDVIAVFEHESDVQPFVDFANSLRPRIKFTVEHEKNQQIPFLDCLLKRENTSISTSVYRKPTHSDRYQHWMSYTSRSVQRAVAAALRTRALRYCMQPDVYKEEIAYIHDRLVKNGYPAKVSHNMLHPSIGPKAAPVEQKNMFVPFARNTTNRVKRPMNDAGFRLIHTNSNTLHQALYYKSKAKRQQRRGVVYKVTCSCGKVYIGSTVRQLSIRFHEHVLDGVGNNSKTDDKCSGLSKHLRHSNACLASA